jgi:hypothetical protein
MKKTMINKEHIEGYLFDHKLEEKVCGPTSKNPGAKYIAGTLDVAVDDEGMNVIQTHFTFVTPVFNSGKVNNTYGVLQKIIESGKNFVTAGIDATKVAIDTALDVNDFYTDGDNGELELVSAKRNEGGFVSIVTALNPNVDKRHTFDLDMVITKVTRKDADEERNIAERVDVKGVIFNFRNEMLPVVLSSTDEGGMDYFESLEATNESPVFTKISGLINNVTTKSTKETNGAFGGAKVDEVSRSFKEWNINWAAPEPYDFGSEEVLTMAELQKCAQDRETKLAAEKARYEEYKAQKNSGTAKSLAATSTVPAGSFKDF